MAEIIVPSRTPARYPKNTTDKIAAIITIEVSTNVLPLETLFLEPWKWPQ